MGSGGSYCFYCSKTALQKSLSERIYLVTGANSGVGLATATQLARQGARVVLASRDERLTREAMDGIVKEVPGASLEYMKLDLASLASVRECAGKAAQLPRLDGLVNNAGVMLLNDERRTTADGFEMQFGTNHLGHFLLTTLLLDKLKETSATHGEARVVVLSSVAHDKIGGTEGKIHWEDIHLTGAPVKYTGPLSYCQSKLANVLFAEELARRVAGTNILAFAVHPGWVQSRLARESIPGWAQNYVAYPFLRMGGMIKTWEGCQPALHCLLEDGLEAHRGAYYAQRTPFKHRDGSTGGWPLRSPNPYANSTENGKRLWEMSEDMIAGRGTGSA